MVSVERREVKEATGGLESSCAVSCEGLASLYGSCESVVFLTCALLILGKTEHPLLGEGVITEQKLHFRTGLIALMC